MKRSQLRDVSMEIMVGAFMFMVLLALGFFTIILSYENIFRSYHDVEVKFEHVRGLRKGDNVFLRGVLIGRVKSLTVDENASAFMPHWNSRYVCARATKSKFCPPPFWVASSLRSMKDPMARRPYPKGRS